MTPDCLPFSPLVGGVDMLMTFTIIVVLVVMDTGAARFLRKGNEYNNMLGRSYGGELRTNRGSVI